MEFSLKATSRINWGPGSYLAGRSVKSQGQRSLRIVALGSASGKPIEIKNPSDRREGLSKGECNLIRNKPWWSLIFKFGKGVDLQIEPGDVAAERERRGLQRGRSVFTEEKARALRKELRETENWHDHMYHSAIASRLAISDQDSA